MVAYIGSFGAGFINSYLRARQLRMQEAWYDEMIKYYEYMMDANKQGRAGDAIAAQGGWWQAGQLGDSTVPLKGGKYSFNELVAMAQKAGFTGNDARTAAAISLAESSGDPSAKNTSNKDGSTDYGLMQINSSHGDALAKSALDPQTSFNIAHDLFVKRGGFGDWVQYNNGEYKKFYPTAEAAAKNPSVVDEKAPELETGAPAAKPASAAAPAIKDTKPVAASGSPKEGDTSPAGGPWVKSGNNLFQTDKSGNIISNQTGVALPKDDKRADVGIPPYQVAGLEWAGPPTAQGRADLAAHLVQPSGYGVGGLEGKGPGTESDPIAPEAVARPVEPYHPIEARDRLLDPQQKHLGTFPETPPGLPVTTAEGRPDLPQYGPPQPPHDIETTNISPQTYGPDTATPGPDDPSIIARQRMMRPQDSQPDQGGGYPSIRPGEINVPLAPGVTDERRFPAAAFDYPPSSTPTGMPVPPVTARSEGKGKDADKPTEKAQPTSGKTPPAKAKGAPTKAIPEQGDVLRGMPVGGQGGGHETPTGMVGGQQIYTAAGHPQDPFWRPNPPLNTKQRQEMEKTAPSKTAQAPTATTQQQWNLSTAFKNMRENIGRAISGDTGPTKTADAQPVKSVVPGATMSDREALAASKQPIQPPPRPPSMDDGGDTPPDLPKVQVPDVPPARTDIPVQDPFAGVNVAGIPYQPGQTMQAQPIPVPYQKRQDIDTGDEGDVDPTIALAARKGGPIYKFAGGGGAGAFGPIQSPSTNIPLYTPADMTARQNVTKEMQTAIPISGATTFQNISDAYAKMTPDQQKWYTTAGQDLQIAGQYPGLETMILNQLGPYPSSTPSAPTAPTAPIAPAPPSTKTVASNTVPIASTAVNPASGDTNTSGTNTATGTPLHWAAGQTGTITAPKTSPGVATFGGTDTTSTNYTPGFTNTQSGGSGTTYGVDATDTLTNQAGYAQGGWVAYDDGGDVSPASLGAPPGLPMGGQGQQPIPPVYYNPATFSPYGAGVGRGVSYASAPTLVAQAAPTYSKGGEVMAFDDGGDVGSGDVDYGGAPAPIDASFDAPIEDASYGGGYLPPRAGIPMGGMRSFGMGMRMGARRPPMSMGRMPQGQGEGMFAPDMTPTYTPQGYSVADMRSWAEGGPGSDRPIGAPPDFPQYTDGQGNPSYGSTSAISSVLHFFGNALGLGGQDKGVLPNDPMIQTNRRDFANKVGAYGVGPAAEKLFNDIAPPGSLNRDLRVIGGLEAVYKWHLANGDPDGAVRSAASIVMYLDTVVAQYGKSAVQNIQNGNLQAGIDDITKADANTPTGQKVSGRVNPATGNTVIAEQRNMRGDLIWKGEISAPMLLAVAGRIANGQMFYDQLEGLAARYDPHTAAMLKQKQEQASDMARSQAIIQSFNKRYGIPGGPGQGQAQGAPKIVPVGDQGAAPQAQPAVATTGMSGPGSPSLTAGSEGAPGGAPGGAPLVGIPHSQSAPNARTGAPAPAGPGTPASPDASGQAQAAQPASYQPPTYHPRWGGAYHGDITPAERTANLQAEAPPPADQTVNEPAIEAQVADKYKTAGGYFKPTQDMPRPEDYGLNDPRLTKDGYNKAVAQFQGDMKNWERRQDEAYRDERTAKLGQAHIDVQARNQNINRQWEATKIAAADKSKTLAQARAQAHTDEVQRKNQAHQEFMDNVNKQSTIANKAEEPRTDQEINSILRINPDTGTQGISGKFQSVPEEYLAKSPTVAVGSDGKKMSDEAAQQQYETNYTEAERGVMDQVWQSAVKWNKVKSPATLADVITGVLNGTYRDPHFDVVPYRDIYGNAAPNDPYMEGTGSKQRIVMTIYRPGSRTTESIVLPDQDMRNLMKTHLRYFDRQPPAAADKMMPEAETGVYSTDRQPWEKGIPWKRLFNINQPYSTDRQKPYDPSQNPWNFKLRDFHMPGAPDFEHMTKEEQSRYFGIPVW